MDARQKHIVAYATRMNRIERNLSIEELAEAAGIEPEILAAIEAEEYDVTGATVVKIADAMGIPNWNLMV